MIPICQSLESPSPPLWTVASPITIHNSPMCPLPPNPEESFIHTIKDITCEGSRSLMQSAYALSHHRLGKSPTVGKIPFSQEISPTRRYLFAPTQKDLRHNTGPCLTCSLDSYLEHQAALNPAASILATMEEHAISPNLQAAPEAGIESQPRHKELFILNTPSHPSHFYEILRQAKETQGQVTSPDPDSQGI